MDSLSVPANSGQFGPAFDDMAIGQSRFDFWGVLDRRKWIVFLGLLAGLALGWLTHYKTPPKYESTAVVRIFPRRATTPSLARYHVSGVLPDIEEIMPTRHDKIIAEEVTIRQCLDGDGKSGDLYSLPSFAGEDKESVVQLVKKNLEVLQDKEDPFNYTISYISTDANDAPTIVNNLIRTYRNNLTDWYKVETESSITKLLQLTRERENEYRQLSEAMRELELRDNVPRINANQGTDIYSLTISSLTPKIAQDRERLAIRTAERNAAVEALDRGPAAAAAHLEGLKQQNRIRVPQGTDDVEFTISEQNRRLMMEIESALDTQRLVRGAGHPQVVSLEKRLVRMQKMIDEQAAAANAISGKSDDPMETLSYFVRTLDMEVDHLQETLVREEVELQKAKVDASTVQAIRNEKEHIDEQRKHVVTQLNELKAQLSELNSTPMASASQYNERGFDFIELRSANNKAEQVWPILPIILSLGGLIGSLLGFGLGCLVDLADKTFHNPDEVIRHLGLPLIGHIPVIATGKRYQMDGSLIDTAACVHHRPRCQSSEAFRAVRTALFFNGQGKEHCVFQVTSPTPGDGKSTIAANLAISIAQSGKRVLLVDGDMRRPRQASMFNIESKEGFATVLSGETIWTESVFPVTEVEGLYLLPCGAKPGNPAELSTSPQVKNLIEQMRNEYDFVIIDTPPLLAVTDPCPIAARVDGVILSMRIKKNVRISTERAVDILRNLGANVVGVVVNGVGAQSGYGSQYSYGAYRAGYSYNGYGYGYGYGYGQYYDDKRKDGEAGNVPLIESVAASKSKSAPKGSKPQPFNDEDDLDFGALEE